MYLALAGRICLALIFLNAGITHLNGFQGFVGGIAGKGLPLPGLLAIGAIVFLLAGALSLLLGYRTRIGAWLLIAFLIPTTLVYHLPVGESLADFLRNLALIGGLLMTISNGPGLMSLDAKMNPHSVSGKK